MARTGLAKRLGRIRETQKRAGLDAETGVNADARATGNLGSSGASRSRDNGEARWNTLDGWIETAADLYERESIVTVPEWRPSFSEHLPLLFPRERETLRAALESGAARAAESMAFFDLETTGLSHGAGTVAFMAGIARFVGTGTLSITQLLMADYPAEGVFLSRFAELAGKADILVSFNGKCFDAQILQTRFLMNGMKPRFLAGSSLHLDLLFPSRRLWKHELGSCRMADIESGILGSAREDDLPGSEAPEAWFDFLKNGEAERLLAVGVHNLTDTASLARVLFSLDAAIDAGSGRAALIRALDLRSLGDYGNAASFLAPLAASGDPVAARILAIDSEHRLGDLKRALELAKAIDDGPRAERIARKLARRQ